MTLPSKFTDPILRITLTLAQYPILSDRIREIMRQDMFTRGIISQDDFEALVRKQAIRSQKLEGISDPFAVEEVEVWETRQRRVQGYLTDFYYATNLPYEVFEDIVRQALSKPEVDEEISIYFNPELAPKYMLFEQARLIEDKPKKEQVRFQAHLEEIKVVLIRAMISDQLAYVRIAKKWFSTKDLRWILRRKIGYGKIGGKAAGMLLAASILRGSKIEGVPQHLKIPESFFLGADLMYTFMKLNGLMHWNNQKYKPEEEIRADYQFIHQEYLEGKFPEDIADRLKEMLEELKGKPLIVRSSSLLEDNFGTSFAGKYESYFCPNQGSAYQNMKALTEAIIRIYASTVNPDALMYRRNMGLQDYDERMAILVQEVQGEKIGNYYLPHAAGVAFSRNLYRWDPNIQGDDGFLRMVWGLGTRAVDRVGNDYPRLVALSHPTLRPESTPKEILKYSQQYVDLIDLEQNEFVTLPVKDVLSPRNKVIRYIAQAFKDGYLTPIRSTLMADTSQELVLTLNGLLSRTPFAKRMQVMLHTLEENYELPVDMEFTTQIDLSNPTSPEVIISILQCRPQSHLKNMEVQIPKDLPKERIIFSTKRMVPHGHLDNICYIIYVPPEAYYALPTPNERKKLGRAIGRLNAALENRKFICIGPGRWGTSNPDLGVHVGFADIYNACALVEITGEGIGPDPEPSFGTHFFQDLMETQTYPLAIYLEDDDVIFNRDFFNNAPNQISKFISDTFLKNEIHLQDSLKVIDIHTYQPGYHLELIMDYTLNKAVAFLAPDQEKK